MATKIEPGPEATYTFSTEQFARMIADGIFAEDDRLELIDGEIVYMTPISHGHAAVVSNLEFILRERLGRAAYVWAQQPLVLDEHSRPQPDLVLLKWRDDRYIPTPPTAHDALLVVEVADTSLSADRGRKRAKYAAAGVPEYWIVNLQTHEVEVYSDPVGDTYANQKVVGKGGTLSLPGGLGATLAVDEVFGESS